ncbi:MAG: DUF4258 domain-containing protein [Rhodobacter sp.]|nr:DUF4258 domain-containing protein [Rhodobacter sp.]MCA3493589.1 DUF4258 domain-containing protein [Rhodobacter sp.]MCA3500591.1 DUF4258 domain-containing protein [Rhodobacter sp.]MCA3503347.1 DUF4258 domain-containing protein [Rhodobacter sp.]MCA3515461.1 DUF4258 domain-containing protein [Rhodobacter sp.]
MMKPRHVPSRVEFRPSPQKLLASVRTLAATSGNVSFGKHALDRMEERNITTLDVLRVLRSGEIEGKIEAGQGLGEWKCKIVERRPRARAIGVATIVKKENRLFIKTVEWEDR